MSQSVSWLVYGHMFCKPLNPILGETHQSHGVDGSKCYYEQTSHHPPRTHYLIEGPEGRWTLDGYTEMEIYGGVTSSTANCLGFKRVRFPDGSEIKCNHTSDTFYGIFIGSIIHQMTKRVTYTDE
jgi:hypothetical protein